MRTDLSNVTPPGPRGRPVSRWTSGSGWTRLRSVCTLALLLCPPRASPNPQPDANVGSLARDALARERNYLSTLKLSLTVFAVGVVFILRFRFRDESYPSLPETIFRWRLGLGLAACAVSTMILVGSTIGYLRVTRLLLNNAMVAESAVVDEIIYGSAVILVFTACVYELIELPTI